MNNNNNSVNSKSSDFFKFLIGFMFIISASLFVYILINRYELDNKGSNTVNASDSK